MRFRRLAGRDNGAVTEDLQERRGCDVNVLLFCCWLGASGRPTLTAERLRAILRVSDVWQAEIVRPLRQVRRLSPANRQRLQTLKRTRARSMPALCSPAKKYSRFKASR